MKRILVVCFCVLNFKGISQNNQLAYYVTKAFLNSPLLKDIRNQVASIKYDSLLIRATAKPQVTGSSFNTYAPVINGFGYDGAITNGGNFNALIGINKLLPNKQNLIAQFENLQLQQTGLGNSSKITEQDIKRTITAQYITAFGSLQQVNFNKEISKLLLKQEVILKKLTQANVYKQSDYLAFVVTMQQQSLISKQLNIQYLNDIATLNYICGILDTSFVELIQPEIEFNPLLGAFKSPLFKQFVIDSLKLNNSKQLININYRPKINLFADGGFISTLANTPYKNIGTSFGVSFTMPIYDGKQKKMQYGKINIAELTRKNYQSFFLIQYQQQVAQLLQQLNATESLLTDIKSQLKYTQSLIDVNGKLLEVGEVRITDFVLALNNYIIAQNLITQNTIARLQTINQLNYWNR